MVSGDIQALSDVLRKSCWTTPPKPRPTTDYAPERKFVPPQQLPILGRLPATISNSASNHLSASGPLEPSLPQKPSPHHPEPLPPPTQLPRTRARPPTFTRPRPSETISLPIATGCRPQPRRPPRPAATMVLSGTRRPTAKRRRGASVCAKTAERSQFLRPVCRSRLFNINKLQFFPPLLRKFLTNEAASLPVIEKAPSYLSIPTSPGQANEATTSAASRVAVSIENQAHPRPGPL